MMFLRSRSTLSPPAVEQRSLQLSDKHITYTLKRSSKRRSIGLRIDERGLTVSMPLRASEKWLHSVLQDKASWVLDRLENWQAGKVMPVIWQDGASIPFRGEVFTLCVVPDKVSAAPRLQGTDLILQLNRVITEQRIEKLVTQWYREQALQVFRECVAHFAPLMEVSPQVVRLSSARTQWGSCNARGVVSLNWHLVKLSLPLIDYVVIHELAHLKEMNHSAAFWRVVESACPDYLELRKQLRDIRVG
ncbi:MAG: M48 family metallopeptidase [Gammaproteobacteria bacterium]|nr:M48 family metallopeptidase [Gammaproteobacteria bacterium]MBU1623477.1 M48 family metallopeptidase [Gammaproteobacteria bacterium]MBU1982316.1 M48 family metallopeptidase [Gammaproteobacteria bacterium]